MKAKVLRELVHLFRKLFVFRHDAYIEWRNGTLVAVREHLSDEVLRDHLTGKRRIGTYFLKTGEPLTPKLVFDVDIKSRKLVKRIVKRLRKHGAFPYVERSKSKGFHIWVFLNKPVSARRVRSFAQIILLGLSGPDDVEIFPKQDFCDDLGYGLSLPLFGADVPTNRTVFLDADFDPELSQTAYLKAMIKTPRRVVTNIVGKTDLEKADVPKSQDDSLIPKRGRNNFLTKFAGSMRRYGADKESIFDALKVQNNNRCVPPLEDKEVMNIAASVSRYRANGQATPVKRIQSSDLQELLQNVEFFHTANQDPYAVILAADRREIRQLNDPAFRQWLSAAYYKKFGSPVRSQAMNDAIEALTGKARYDSPEKTVFTRIAEHDGAIYLDLCNEEWSVVKIDANGWRVVSDSPVNFRRTRGMLPLPTPLPGGTTKELRSFLNVGSRADFVLLTSWLLSTFNPEGPYPILLLQGEAGSAKSTTSRVLRELIDPNTSPLRSGPRSDRALMIAAINSRILVFDNISCVRAWLSDAFCRLATGAGLSERELYSNDQEKLLEATRPIILNGIDGIASRGDLLDRCLIVYLPVIEDQERKPEKSFREKFKKAQPRILGALLDAVSAAWEGFEYVRLDGLPRMADFTRWVTAAEPAMGWRAGTFLRSYKANLRSANALALEASPIMPAVREVCAGKEFEGTAAELLEKLTIEAGDRSKDRYWPKTGWSLSNMLRRLAPNLRSIGGDISFLKSPGTNSKRLIRILLPLSEKPSPES